MESEEPEKTAKATMRRHQDIFTHIRNYVVRNVYVAQLSDES